ncbi:hypothetical protein [Nocardiopsis sp. CNT-189]|uniref:hypothetical protein n=1 Tax=Nocardiopsis oceanisediminis TaxID=2816862 RepID=UPI003B3B75B3
MRPVSSPLHDSDPRQLGGYRLSGRLSRGSSGVVYLGEDGSGRRVEVALLSEGAAADPDARERFRAAVAEGRGASEGERVLGAGTEAASAAWVAVPHGGPGPGAAAYLRSVEGGAGPVRAGAAAVLRPHWSVRSGPASARWLWPGGHGGSGAAEAPPQRGVVVGVMLLLLLAVLLIVLLYFWMSMLSRQAGGSEVEPSRSPSSSQEPSPSESPSPSQSPGEEEGDPSPSPEPSDGTPEATLDEDELEELPGGPGSLA